MRSILLFLLFPLFTFSQDISFPRNESREIEYTDVVMVDSSSAGTLFGRARLFISKAFASGKAVTDLTDIENKTVAAKGWTTVAVKILGFSYPLELWFMMTVQCRDDRYKYTFNDIEVLGRNNNGITTWQYKIDGDQKPAGYGKKQWNAVREQADQKIKVLIALLGNHMKNKKDDNW